MLKFIRKKFNIAEKCTSFIFIELASHVEANTRQFFEEKENDRVCDSLRSCFEINHSELDM